MMLNIIKRTVRKKLAQIRFKRVITREFYATVSNLQYMTEDEIHVMTDFMYRLKNRSNLTVRLVYIQKMYVGEPIEVLFVRNEETDRFAQNIVESNIGQFFEFNVIRAHDERLIEPEWRVDFI